MNALVLLFGIIVVCAVVLFLSGLVVGLAYERSLRRWWYRSAVESAVYRLLDAEAAACNPRSKSSAVLEYEKARARVARLVAWQRPALPVRAPARSTVAPAAQELAS
jgi:hypothetical protein